jgi:crossover junction endodeoxyribonuclease RusA
MVTIALPWPTGPQWPNRRPHWSVLARHRKAAHKAAWALCMEAGAPKGPAHLTVTLHPPRKPGRMNIDGCISANKAAVDGIAQALGVDDSELRISWPVAFSEPVKGGLVVVTVREAGR